MQVGHRRLGSPWLHFFCALAAVIFHSQPAAADTFSTLVGYRCEADKDRIVISYRNGEDEALPGNKGSEEWDPWSLVKSASDDGHIGELETITRSCRLSDGDYIVSIGPSPGNFNTQGRCGADMSAWVKVTRGLSTTPIVKLEFEGDCHGHDPVVTQVVVNAGGDPPTVTRVPKEKFYGYGY